MQLSRRALFRSILPLSALAASIAASLKSPQAAPSVDYTRATNPYWKRQTTPVSGDAYENLRKAMREIYAQCERYPR